MNYSAISIIYNPQSTGSSETLARAMQRDILAKTPKQKVSLSPTSYARHAEELAYSLAKKSHRPLIISSSGDGGYHEVVNGIMKAQREGYQAVAGLLPAGNANDHYRNLHTEDFVELIARGKERTVDLLKFEGVSEGQPVQRYGHSYIGFGMTPFVGKHLNKNKLNIFNEVWIVTRALFDLRPVRLNLGKKSRYYDSVIISNVASMSKYLKIAKPSRVDDGKFEVTIFRRRSKLKFIALLLRASFSGVPEDMQVKDFSLKVVKKTLVQIDGEILTLDADSQVKISIEKRILPCIV